MRFFNVNRYHAHVFLPPRLSCRQYADVLKLTLIAICKYLTQRHGVDRD
jgi:hypothetical protein